MKLACISDIHLGRGDRTDRFGHRPAAFHAFLDHLEGLADEVVLLGDVLDTHHGRIPLAFFREVRRICDVHRGVADRLLGGRYRLVSGNHDECLARLPGVVQEYRLTADSRRLLFLHGHQFDRLIRTSPTLCALGNYLGGVAQRHGMNGALALLDKVDDLANAGGGADRNTLYRTHALTRAAADGADVIVLGHTHQQDVARRNGRTYLNVGACLEGRFEFGFIDTRRGIVEPRTWSHART